VLQIINYVAGHTTVFAFFKGLNNTAVYNIAKPTLIAAKEQGCEELEERKGETDNEME